ncbi:hypothetical protein BGY98DRAFT_992310 [Russula aff. rugulosa BPL654]|nr:hypothetical protein BGY98DRAFT_992310 [Russula aff. rugulosa BPL654]
MATDYIHLINNFGHTPMCLFFFVVSSRDHSICRSRSLFRLLGAMHDLKLLFFFSFVLFFSCSYRP